MIDWDQIRRVLLIRLRSIGDTVLMTPCLTALKRFRPDLHVTVLLEELSAPLLMGHPQVDEVMVLARASGQWSDGLERLRTVRRLRQGEFDVVFNMHGGTTATFLAFLSRARCRVGYRGYSYSFLLTHRAPDPGVIWKKPDIHSVEQQIGLLKWAGLPIADIPTTSLRASDDALERISGRLSHAGVRESFALIHPVAASEDKRWPAERFARLVRGLESEHGLVSVIIGAGREASVLDTVKELAGAGAQVFADLHLDEVMALCSLARVFVGNDSGPAHIAMAVRCPTVVIFGASDYRVWRPWGDAPHAIVSVEKDPDGRRLEPSDRIAHVQVEEVLDVAGQLLTRLR